MSDEIKLYHVSFDMDNEPLYKQFVPRAPESHEYGEDNITKCICFSDSIEGCLDSIGENKLPDVITSRTKIIVWEKVFSLSDSELIDWKYLYENDLICDAAMTHEYWYKKSIMLEGSYFLLLDLDKAIDNRENTGLSNLNIEKLLLLLYWNMEPIWKNWIIWTCVIFLIIGFPPILIVKM